MYKKISVYEDWFALFQLPKGFEEAQEAHEVEGWFEFLDWPCENLETTSIWFLDSECFIKDIWEEQAGEEDEDIQFNWMFKQF